MLYDYGRDFIWVRSFGLLHSRSHESTLNSNGDIMKNFLLGFFVCFAACSVAYQIWEAKRHVPVLIQEKQIMVPVPVFPNQVQPPVTLDELPEAEGLERNIWET